MVEMSAQNENYRSQVMNLTTQVDIAETQMRAFQNQDPWIGTDLQDFHRLNDELSQQKEELQTQIALQAQEIENLTEEIKDLRTELDRVSKSLDVEREKQNFQANLGDRSENQR